jgi:transposase-like protein
MSQEQNGKSEEAGTKTEVVVKAKRRQHSAEYKLRILREVDECQGKGEVGALLRREGLYSSLVSKWREQRERGGLTGLSEHRRGPKVDANAVEVARLQRENKRLQEKLERAELIIDVHTCPGGRCQGKKVAWLLGVPLSDNNLSEDS